MGAKTPSQDTPRPTQNGPQTASKPTGGRPAPAFLPRHFPDPPGTPQKAPGTPPHMAPGTPSKWPPGPPQEVPGTPPICVVNS